MRVLTLEERTRLESDLPTSFDVTCDGSTYTYSVETWWDDEDHTRSYPEAILGWKARSVAEADAQSLGSAEIDERPGEANVAYTHATRLYDELSVTCLVEDATDANGVPPKPRVEAFAERFTDCFRYEFDQNSVGANGERPVVARLSKAPTHDAHADPAGTDVQEYAFTVRLHYTDEQTETVDTVQDVEYTIQTN